MVVGMRALIVAGLLATAVASAEGRRIRLGGVSVQGGYMSGPAWWGPASWGPYYGYGPGLWRPWGPAWWDPFWFNGWAHPGFWNGFVQGPGMGEVKLTDAPREASVYLDGAYAGQVAKLKSMWLQPGVYALEIRDDSGAVWDKKIYVLSGKTLELRPALQARVTR
jgi:hypothetical protein